jgi:undecaprenyl-diphosphatase
VRGFQKISPWWALLAFVLGVLLMGDVELARILKFDWGRGRMVALWGYWLGRGDVLVLLMLVLGLAGWRLSRPAWKAAALDGLSAFAVSGILSRIFKHLIGRPRPRLMDETLSAVGPTLASGFDSFPSGHATTAAAVAFVLAWRFPKWSPLFFGLAAFVAASRVLGGSHFPLDIFGGVILGLISGMLVVDLGQPLHRKLADKGWWT